MTTNDTKLSADWEAIETAFRLGVLSIRQIGAEHGVSDTAIRKRAKKDGWTRDLSAKVRAKADEVVRRAAVRSEVRADAAGERELVEINAQMQANVILESRGDIRKARTLAMALFAELEAITENMDVFQQLGDLMTDPATDPGRLAEKIQENYRKAISLPSRIDSMKKLADTLKTLIGLEREAFGIDGRKGPGQTLDEFLDSLAAAE